MIDRLVRLLFFWYRILTGVRLRSTVFCPFARKTLCLFSVVILLGNLLNVPYFSEENFIVRLLVFRRLFFKCRAGAPIMFVLSMVSYVILLSFQIFSTRYYFFQNALKFTAYRSAGPWPNACRCTTEARVFTNCQWRENLLEISFITKHF